MKNLEEFIKLNLSAFDEEPANGHHERQAAARERAKRFVVLKRYARWQAQRERRSPYLRKAALFAVAASVAAVMWSIFFLHNGQSAASPDTVVICENTPDMKSCYFGKMNDIAAQIREIAATLDNIDPQEVMMEVDNLLATGEDMEQELPAELSDEAATAVLADYYQHHLESLQTIIQRLSDVMM
ncbi:MAG: hypothetical protein LBG31_04795 [Prevotellaceae bacterium]|jgi:hypothetical protein|nr:hypothetical protein [Prevotellaceae bacterium]